MELKGTRTEQNLTAAFRSKAHSSNLYDYYAYTCMHEGYQLISNAFTDSARTENTHAKVLFQLLHGPIKDTMTNIRSIIEEETLAGTKTFPEFAETARREGFAEAAFFFEEIAKVHLGHAAKYTEILHNIETGSVFMKSEKKDWVCKVCGYVHSDFSAPEECPMCRHPKGLFYIRAENY